MKRAFICLVGCLCAWAAAAAEAGDLVIRGVVRDRDSRQRLENVHITLEPGTIGTVSNADGRFVLKIPADGSAGGVRLSHIGYLDTLLSPEEVAAAARQPECNLYLQPTSRIVDVVTVIGGDPRAIVEEALRRVTKNYAVHDHLFSAFYRETVQKRSRYIGVSEAVADVYKTGYDRRDVLRDRVQIRKGRRLLRQSRRDTLAVKVAGGPVLPLLLDVVKNGDALFDERDIDDYAFAMELPVSAGDRVQYVVSFRPRVVRTYALFEGRLFIDQQTLTITRAEYSLDVSDRDKATRVVLQRRPYGLKFRPQEVSFVVTYRQQEGRAYLNYMRNTIRFRCNWARRLFASNYTSCAEMVMVERSEGEASAIARRDAFAERGIFSDLVDDYWDEDYWRDYNIIEPTESLEQAVHRLKRQ